MMCWAALTCGSRAAGMPQRCTVGQDAHDGTPVKVDQPFLWEPGLFPEEKQSLKD